MKLSTILSLLLSVIAINTQVSKADITISEAIELEGDNGTLLQIRNDNGDLKEKIVIKSFLARLSPDKKHIAYIDKLSKGGFRMALRHVSGNKLEYPPFLKTKRTLGWAITGMEWSHDGKEIALVMAGSDFYQKARPVRVIVYNFDNNKFNTWYESESQTTEAAYLLSVKWFPDNKRILVADNLTKGKEKVIVATFNRSKQRKVYNGATLYSNIVNNGNNILMITNKEDIAPSPSQNKSSTKCQVIQFDLANKTISKIIEANLPGNMQKILIQKYIINSADSALLILPGDISTGRSITVIDLFNKKIETINFGNSIFFPQAISQDGRYLLGKCLLCSRAEQGYEIFNLQTNKFKHICSRDNTLSGEASLGAELFFNRIEWIR